ncbi:MAG: hypothetical protein WA160_04265 [Pseudobdellovibrio sp.]
MNFFKIYFFILTLSISSMVFAAELIPIRNINVSSISGCGAPPQPGHPEPVCPASITITFEAEISGLCDLFSAEFKKSRGKIFLFIQKEKIPNCTRPEYQFPIIESLEITVSENLPEGQILLANPLLINNLFRP